MSCNCCPNSPLWPNCGRQLGQSAFPASISKEPYNTSFDYYIASIFNSGWIVNLNFKRFLTGSYAFSQNLGQRYIWSQNLIDNYNNLSVCTAFDLGNCASNLSHANHPFGQVIPYIIGTVDAPDMKPLCLTCDYGYNPCLPILETSRIVFRNNNPKEDTVYYKTIIYFNTSTDDIILSCNPLL